MTQEEKELLLKDICGRLPYDLIVQETFQNAKRDVPVWDCGPHYIKDHPEKVKPYLRPMSSMTEEEASDMFNMMFPKSRILSLEIKNDRVTFAKVDAEENFGHITLFFNKIYSLEQIDWLNARHFDYRSLIPMGLALEAPENC